MRLQRHSTCPFRMHRTLLLILRVSMGTEGSCVSWSFQKPSWEMRVASCYRMDIQEESEIWILGWSLFSDE